MSSPIQLVKKGDDWRFTVDFKNTVNKATRNDDHALPITMHTLQERSRYRWFCKVDLTNAYWQVKVTDEPTKLLFGFHIPGRGYYVWNVLPQGLKQAPSIFQRYIDSIREAEGIDAPGLFDDFIVAGNTPEDCATQRDTLLKALTKYGLKVNTDKSVLIPQRQIDVLGFSLEHNKVLPRDDYIKSIAEFRVDPTDRKSLRKFLGKLAHVHALYPAMQPVKAILFSCLNRNKLGKFKLDPGATEAISLIKRMLDSPRALQHLSDDPTEPVDLFVDGGDQGWAMQLFQSRRLVGSISRKYAVTNLGAYSSQIKEAYALKEGLRHFRDQLHNRKIVIYHDHEKLPNVFAKSSGTNNFITRLIQEVAPYLSEATFKWVPRTHPGIVAVDALGRYDR